jgi:hypothetical protein
MMTNERFEYLEQQGRDCFPEEVIELLAELRRLRESRKRAKSRKVRAEAH